MISVKYYRALDICYHIWENPWNKDDFKDIFHTTIFRCLNTLDRKHNYTQDFLKSYFFKSFRINMVRYFGYAYNRLTSGIEIENTIIPVAVESAYDNHLDGFGMLDYVEMHHGKDVRDMLWDNYNGFTYRELEMKRSYKNFPYVVRT